MTLSADTSMTLDAFAVRAEGQDQAVHSFTNVSVSPDGTKHCSTACFCLGPQPPEVLIDLRKGDDPHTIASGQSAPSGCCESM